MEITGGAITAVVNNYKKDGKELSLYREGKLMATHTFPEEVETYYYNYFKAGIYYQNKDSPKIFSEIFMKDLEVVIE